MHTQRERIVFWCDETADSQLFVWSDIGIQIIDDKYYNWCTSGATVDARKLCLTRY